MNFSHSTIRSSEQRAFTLIELLVVITIIAVLAGLLLPVVQKVMENSRKVSAKTTETQIVAAVNAYQTEYGQYPVTAASPAVDTTFGFDPTTNHNGALFDVLRALNQATTDASGNSVLLNSRRIVYFESKNVKSSTNPRDGFIADATKPKGNPNAPTVVTLNQGDLVDPWGNMYCVRIDSGYTNAVMNPYSATGNTATADDNATDSAQATDLDVLRTGVIAWSWGNDGIAGSKGNTTFTAPYSPAPGDDVDSWQ